MLADCASLCPRVLEPPRCPTPAKRSAWGKRAGPRRHAEARRRAPRRVGQTRDRPGVAAEGLHALAGDALARREHRRIGVDDDVGMGERVGTREQLHRDLGTDTVPGSLDHRALHPAAHGVFCRFAPGACMGSAPVMRHPFRRVCVRQILAWSGTEDTLPECAVGIVAAARDHRRTHAESGRKHVAAGGVPHGVANDQALASR